MLAARRRSVNLEVMRYSVVCAKGLSTCRRKEGVSSFFFSLALPCGFVCRWFEKCGWNGERLQVNFAEKVLDTRVSAHNTHKHRQPAGCSLLMCLTRIPLWNINISDYVCVLHTSKPWHSTVLSARAARSPFYSKAKSVFSVLSGYFINVKDQCWSRSVKHPIYQGI